MATGRIPAPRIFCIPATRAPVVAVLRRGPSDWCHVGRWDLERPRYQSGAWFRGTLYPQKCDLAPDGRWLAYSALKANASWPGGTVHEAISRLPWLTALAAWEAGTTYTRGIRFDDEVDVSNIGEPDVGDSGPVLARYGLKLNRAIQFAVERRRGWVETESTPPREAGGPWDENRSVQMEKPRPGYPTGPTLLVEGAYAGFRSFPERHHGADYSLLAGQDFEVLDGVQWADWDGAGRLLTATTDGRLQIRTLDEPGQSVIFEADLSRYAPQPEPPPRWAEEW